MKSHAYSGNLSRLLRHRAVSRLGGLGEDWVMSRLVGWTATIVFSAVLIWLTSAVEPYWARLLGAALLMVVGILTGIRLGSDSAAAYTKDLQRLNKVLADQNRELEAANSILLTELSAEPRTPSKSA